MKPFSFATAQQLVFGRGSLKQLSSVAAQLGDRCLLVCGPSKRFGSEVESILAANGIGCEYFPVSGEPTVAIVAEGAQTLHQKDCHSVIGLGGGSAIDAGKAIATLATNPGDPFNYLEVVGRGNPLTQTPLPFVAIPTTAGTGAEATKNAVLAVPEQRVKVSLRSPEMLPTLALIDPSLTDTLPREETANAGLDALTQLIEPFLSIKANSMTDALCRAAIPSAVQALARLAHSLDDHEARDHLAYSALNSGIALANAGLGAVHGFAGPLGGMFPAPHGAVCARLMCPVLHANYQAITTRANQSEAHGRFVELATLLTGSSQATPEDAIKLLQELVDQFNIRPLSSFGITEQDFSSIIEKSQRASSMKGNPLSLTVEELTEILKQAL